MLRSNPIGKRPVEPGLRIETDRESAYTVEDPGDYLHREPFVVSFRVRGLDSTQAFSFKLVNIHTDPDETDIELDALDDVFVAVQQDGSGEDDVILLGDLNVDERHLRELGRLPDIAHVIAGVKTNTRRTKSYDNIVLDARNTTEYTGHCGVLDLMAEFGLTMDQALNVSDHMPVWAEFSVFESGSGAVIATRPGQGTR
jgi:deoxyribonuclease-1-like protein